ncbi:MAG: substrate-binding domain-containing protein [Pseudomonadota bacterium]
MKERLSLFVPVMALILVILCWGLPAQAAEKNLMMATTTSTDDTGLLAYLMPFFEKDTGISIKWTATGTGKALKLGENCDVDVLLVHAPAAEKTFVENGFGVNRRQIMYNDFVIIGPENDPAGVKGRSVKDALTMIRDAKAAFASRGDDSGTHKQEQALWKKSEMPIPDKESWYIQTGQGMLATINVAEERNAYTMTDRGTYIKYQDQKGDKGPLKILVEGDKVLLNQYSVIAVDQTRCPKAKYDLAMEFSNWMAGKKAQELIKDFKLLGKQLFVPNAE